jgi:hypothetical protein
MFDLPECSSQPSKVDLKVILAHNVHDVLPIGGIYKPREEMSSLKVYITVVGFWLILI